MHVAGGGEVEPQADFRLADEVGQGPVVDGLSRSDLPGVFRRGKTNLVPLVVGVQQVGRGIVQCRPQHLPVSAVGRGEHPGGVIIGGTACVEEILEVQRRRINLGILLQAECLRHERTVCPAGCIVRAVGCATVAQIGAGIPIEVIYSGVDALIGFVAEVEAPASVGQLRPPRRRRSHPAQVVGRVHVVAVVLRAPLGGVPHVEVERREGQAGNGRHSRHGDTGLSIDEDALFFHRVAPGAKRQGVQISGAGNGEECLGIFGFLDRLRPKLQARELDPLAGVLVRLDQLDEPQMRSGRVGDRLDFVRLMIINRVALLIQVADVGPSLELRLVVVDDLVEAPRVADGVEIVPKKSHAGDLAAGATGTGSRQRGVDHGKLRRRDVQ